MTANTREVPEYYFDIETVPLEQHRNDERAGLDLFTMGAHFNTI